MTESSYYEDFISPKNGESEDERKKRVESLAKEIQEVRRFEINLYWIRSNQFFTILTIALTGFGVLISSDYYTMAKYGFASRLYASIIIILGYFTSCAWYLGNRGGKFWQENWEGHYDEIENNYFGPLYKTVSNFNRRRRGLFMGAPYSVGQLNIFLSFVACLAWGGIGIHQILAESWNVFSKQDASLQQLFYVLISDFLLLLAGVFSFWFSAFFSGDEYDVDEKYKYVRRYSTKAKETKIAILE